MKINLLYVFAGTVTFLSGLFGIYAVKYGPYRELDAYMTEPLERDKEYYDEEELESYITDHVADFTEKNGDTVEKVSFTVKEYIVFSFPLEVVTVLSLISIISPQITTLSLSKFKSAIYMARWWATPPSKNEKSAISNDLGGISY